MHLENKTVEDAIRKFFKELSEVREIKKCKTCMCFSETVSDLSKAFDTIDENRLQKIRREVAGWMAECEKVELHDCLACDPCLPVKPFKEFHETLRFAQPRSQKL